MSYVMCGLVSFLCCWLELYAILNSIDLYILFEYIHVQELSSLIDDGVKCDGAALCCGAFARISARPARR